MSTAVKPSTEGDVTAFAISVALHGMLLLLPLVLHWPGRAPPPQAAPLPNSVAMLGNSIEVEAPTTEVAASPAPAAPADVAPSEKSDTAALTPKPATAPVAPAPHHDAVKAASAPVEPSGAEPKPPHRTPKPAQKAAPDGASGSETERDRAQAAGTFGQEGLPAGVRRLGYAFTRAIPAATPADSAWRELPAGHVGTIRIELEVDENNHLGELKHWKAHPSEPSPPAVLERMVERTLLLLRAGQFALSSSNQPGRERLSIEVKLTDQAAEEDAGAEVVQKKFDGASPGHPGTAYFRYGNGRTFEAKVTIVSSGSSR